MVTSLLTQAPHTKSLRHISPRTFEADDAALRSHPSSIAPMERLIARDLPYHQSSNSLSVRHQTSRSNKLRFFHWYIDDWFHVLLRFRTVASACLFVVLWTTVLIIFAAIYVHVDGKNPKENCGLSVAPNTIGFYGAFAFSLETATTVGKWFIIIKIKFHLPFYVESLIPIM